MNIIKPGDLLLYNSSADIELIGVVLAHHDELSEVWDAVFFDDFFLFSGPGVSIYWQTSNTHAYWPYQDIEMKFAENLMRLV